MSEPLARSPIACAPPVIVMSGWEVSGRRATAELTITDWTPAAKLQLRALPAGRAAAAVGVAFGRAARDGDGTLVVGSGPGEWLLIGVPGRSTALTARLERIAAAAQPSGESVTWVDLTHGRALMRLTGLSAPAVLAKVCGIDLSDDVTPDGAAFRSSVASLATDVIRDDLGGNGDGAKRTRSYLLHCERSSGQYLFDALLRAGREFGIEPDGFRPPADPRLADLPDQPDLPEKPDLPDD
ncbi:MAG: sarcosine oxidase subunit gamma [Streptosporangiaceae bacterium]